MPKKMVIINYPKCRPELCDSGICVAALACPHKLIRQEEPYEVPMPDPTVCWGCAECFIACPLKAIELM